MKYQYIMDAYNLKHLQNLRKDQPSLWELM